MEKYVCIKNAIPDKIIPPKPEGKIVKGDIVTLRRRYIHDVYKIQVLEFEEDSFNWYCSTLFVKISPEVREKTVYVSVPETIKEEVKQLILN